MFPGILTNWKQNKHTQANRRPPTNNKQTGHQQEVFQPRIPPAPSPAFQQTNKRPSASCKPIHASSAPATSPPAEQTNKQPPASQPTPKSQPTGPAPRRRGNRRAHYPAPPDWQAQKKGQTLRSDLEEAASYSPTTKCSTIGVNGLNFSVRNG